MPRTIQPVAENGGEGRFLGAVPDDNAERHDPEDVVYRHPVAAA